MADNFVPQVDYTSRDYTAIRNDMISLIPNYAPEWTNRDPADFGMTLIELFSYMGDILNYYIDRSANEAFINTASQRDNILQLARLLAYTPTESTASTVTLTFQNSTDAPITVPALTKVATTNVTSASSNQIIFETTAAVTVPAKVGTVNGSINILATQGETVTDELIGSSTGVSNQLFQLAETPVINNSVTVTINGVSYSRVQYLIDYNNNDPVFTTITNASGVTFILFGDNISGRIPPNGAAIYATYRTGGGVSGNVAANNVQFILTNVVGGLTVNNQTAASGGADPESTDSIRINAPRSIRSLNRAVSLRDYSEIALQVSGVAKSISIADVYTSVTIFIAPFGDRGVESDNTTPTTVFQNLSTEVQTYLIDKSPANTSITVQPPKYVGINLIVNLTILPQYKQQLVKTAVETVLYDLLAFDNVIFADRITLQDVMTTISGVPGVAYAQVQLLQREDQKQQYTITNKALTSNVATLTTSGTHSLTVGQTIKVAEVDTTFNGTFIVTAVTSNTFSYALPATNVLSTASTGNALALSVADVVCDVNEIPEVNTIVLVPTGGIE